MFSQLGRLTVPLLVAAAFSYGCSPETALGNPTPATGGGGAGGSQGSGGSNGSTGGAETGDAGSQPVDRDAGTDVPARFTKQLEIKLNTSASGADIASTLENYPVPIKLSQDNFDFSQAKDDGSDIRFTTPDGDVLPHEIELWDKENQAAAIWVKTTVEGGSTSQTLLMKWGNPAAPDTSDSTAVFSQEENWVAVWHLGDDAGTTQDGFKDATGVNPATGHNLEPGSALAGRMGLGTSLDHLKNQGLKLLENRENFDLAANITFEIWAYVRSFGYNRGYESFMVKGDESWRYMRAGTSRGTEICSDSVSPVCVFSRSQIEFGNWYHFAGVHDGRAVRLYFNGVREAAGNAGADHVSYGDHAVTLGFSLHDGVEQRFMDVIIDEARVTRDSKTDDWIKLDYESLKEGSSFITLGEVTDIAP